MNCEFDKSFISLHADGITAGNELQLTQRHLAVCEECREVLNEIQTFGTALGAVPRLRASDGLIQRILLQSKSGAGKRRRGSGRRILVEILKTVADGLKIDAEREESLRRELPEWVARWVMYI
ncbi:MAG TPA: hypothetical protein VL633_01230 [Bacteroidota bacterium]|nr:hypothetical protein [Bacteroidota bacterium]